MAPNSGSTAGNGISAEQGAPFVSFDSWLEVNGTEAYALYQKEGATSTLTYEGWKSSDRPFGSYLYQLTLDAWDEESSDDEELEQPEKPTPALHSARERIVPVITNGNGKPLPEELSASSAINGAAEPVITPAKQTETKQPKTTKSLLSETIPSPVDEVSRATPAATKEVEPTVSTAKKQKQRGESQSSPTKKPEAIVQSTPVPDDRNPTGPTASPDAPASASSATRKGLRTRTPAQQRPYFHHAKLFEEQVEKVVGQVSNGSKAQSPRPAPVPKIVFRARPETLSEVAKDVSDDDDLSGLLNDELEPQPVSGEKKFKGKGRAWKKTNEDEDDDYHQGSAVKKIKKPVGRPRKTRASLNNSFEQVDHKEEGHDESNKSIMLGVEGSETLADALQPSSKQPQKQKAGRRSSKKILSEEIVQEDSESDVVPSMRGAAGAEADVVVLKTAPALATTTATKTASTTATKTATKPEKAKKKSGKSSLSREIIDDSESDGALTDEATAGAEATALNSSPATATKTATETKKVAKAEKAKRKSRKSFLSNEFIEDSSSLEEHLESSKKTELSDMADANGSDQKQRRKSRKSHLSEEFVRDENKTDMDRGGGANERRVVTPSGKATVNAQSKQVDVIINEQSGTNKRPSLILKFSMGRRLSEVVGKGDVNGDVVEKEKESEQVPKTTPSRKGRKKQKGRGLNSPGSAAR